MAGLRSLFACLAFLGTMVSCGNSDSGRNRAPSSHIDQSARIGVNVNTIAFWDGSRPFANLIYGSGWSMQGTGGAEEIPAANLDANGWVKSLPAGYRALRVLSMPATSADMVCQWNGNDRGSMTLTGKFTNFSRVGSREIRFHYASTYPKLESLPTLSFAIDPSNYVRDIDCREVSSARKSVFDPTFLTTLKGFATIRFVKWQMAVEANTPVTWSQRNKPGDGSYWTKDGVPIEQMIELANEAGADPWFTIPWNADDDYVEHFAATVRAKLAPGRHVYVELSNEVWNGQYPVMRQAQSEGIAAGLPDNQGAYGQAMFRYAQKTRQIMAIWSRAFSGQNQRLVRVLSAQHVNPDWSERMLAYDGTSRSIDALATAPYWAFMSSDFHGQSLDQVMDVELPARIDETLSWAVKQKAVAAKFGKRYISYEGGQHVWLNENAELVARIERDPRMSKLYEGYVRGWNQKVGDRLTLFALTGDISTAGFGLVEYAGQPLSQAPKMRGIQPFLH